MHLDHKIPWKTTAAHFASVRRSTDVNYDLVSLNLPSQAATLGHFSRVLAATIKEFSETEESKVGATLPASKLFSDDVLSFPERHFGLGPHTDNSAKHNPLSPSYQSLEYWRSRLLDGSYSTSDGDLGDAVKMLVIIAAVAPEKALRSEALSSLIRIGENVPLAHLRHLAWGHGFGTDLVAWVPMQVYVRLNLAEAVEKGPVTLLRFKSLLNFLSGHALQDYDYPAQNIPHRAFWNALGVTDSWAARQLDGTAEDEGTVIDPLSSLNDKAHEKARADLRQYLKDCFAILYVYDTFLRHVSGPAEAEEFWLSEIAWVLEMLGCDMDDD